MLHEHGINIRKLGYVRSHVCSAAVRNVLLHEILARAIKNQLRLRLRQKTKEVGQSPLSSSLSPLSIYSTMHINRCCAGPTVIVRLYW